MTRPKKNRALSSVEASAAQEVIAIDHLVFSYAPGPFEPRAEAPARVLQGVTLRVTVGERCLLVGQNGAGKSTLLSLLAGHHLVRGVQVLGREAFFDTALSTQVTYIGGALPIVVDVTVAELLRARAGFDPERFVALQRALQVDPDWHMHRVSSGQRRRVHLLLALLPTRAVLLLDEVTAELDLLCRARLLEFLRAESERGATLLYATHILEGLEAWATRLIWLDGGRIGRDAPLAEIAEYRERLEHGEPSALLRTVQGWFEASEKSSLSNNAG